VLSSLDRVVSRSEQIASARAPEPEKKPFGAVAPTAQRTTEPPRPSPAVAKPAPIGAAAVPKKTSGPGYLSGWTQDVPQVPVPQKVVEKDLNKILGIDKGDKDATGKKAATSGAAANKVTGDSDFQNLLGELDANYDEKEKEEEERRERARKAEADRRKREEEERLKDTKRREHLAAIENIVDNLSPEGLYQRTWLGIREKMDG
jgi:hypothetical protein